MFIETELKTLNLIRNYEGEKIEITKMKPSEIDAVTGFVSQHDYSDQTLCKTYSELFLLISRSPYTFVFRLNKEIIGASILKIDSSIEAKNSICTVMSIWNPDYAEDDCLDPFTNFTTDFLIQLTMFLGFSVIGFRTTHEGEISTLVEMHCFEGFAESQNQEPSYYYKCFNNTDFVINDYFYRYLQHSLRQTLSRLIGCRNEQA